MSRGQVLGVDACRAGWAGVALGPTRVHGHIGADIADLVACVERDGDVRVIGIDIPIGLPDEGRRHADATSIPSEQFSDGLPAAISV